MPITFTLDDLELAAALRTRSEREGRPVEAMVADVVRRWLTDTAAPQDAADLAVRNADVRDGIRLLPSRPGTPVVTHALIQQLMDEAE